MKIFNYLLSIILCFMFTSTYSQVTYEENNPNINPVPLGYLGWNDNNNTLLRIRQHNTVRMQFENENWTGINGTSLVRANRVSMPAGTNLIQTPFSILHLGYSSALGMKRDWMNIGTTYAAQVDVFYVGLIERPLGPITQTDAVLAWGCDDEPEAGPDNLRFLFIEPEDQTPTDADTEQGRETMRISPQGNVGIGNFSSMPLGLNEQPTFRLDVDGNARFRQIQQATGDVLITGMQEDAAGDYSLRYLSFSGNQDEYLAGDGTWQTPDCEWNINGNDLSMGYAGACQTGSVGIGNLAQNDSRLFIDEEVVNNFENVRTLNVRTVSSTAQSFDIGINSEIIGEQYGFGTAVRGIASGGKRARGGHFTAALGALSSDPAIGVLGTADNFNTDNTLPVFGVAGIAESNVNGSRAYGIYGEGIATNGAQGIAAYFAGVMQQGQPSINLSDESVKTNIQGIEDANSLLMQLNPTSYNYVSDGPLSYLNGQFSYGFVAQDVQEVLPEVTKDFYHPAKFNEEGEEISPEVNLLGVQYDSFIPIIVAGYQEQQAVIDQQASTISEMQSQIDELYTMVADCCTDASNRSQSTGDNTDQYELEIEKPSLDQNVPNPFQEKTTITYRLPERTSIKVLVRDSNGKLVETLVEGQMPEGEYTIRWDATGLESGIYFYSLQSNGVELVKRAVKL